MINITDTDINPDYVNSIVTVTTFFAEVMAQPSVSVILALSGAAQDYKSIQTDAANWLVLAANLSSVASTIAANQTITYNLSNLSNNIAQLQPLNILQSGMGELIGAQGTATQFLNIITSVSGFPPGLLNNDGLTLDSFIKTFNQDFDNLFLHLNVNRENVAPVVPGNGSSVTNNGLPAPDVTISKTITAEMGTLQSAIGDIQKRLTATSYSVGDLIKGKVFLLNLGSMQWAYAIAAKTGDKGTALVSSPLDPDKTATVASYMATLSGNQLANAQLYVISTGLADIYNDGSSVNNALEYMQGIWLRLWGLNDDLVKDLQELSTAVNNLPANYTAAQANYIQTGWIPTVQSKWSQMQNSATVIYASSPAVSYANPDIIMQLPVSAT